MISKLFRPEGRIRHDYTPSVSPKERQRKNNVVTRPLNINATRYVAGLLDFNAQFWLTMLLIWWSHEMCLWSINKEYILYSTKSMYSTVKVLGVYVYIIALHSPGVKTESWNLCLQLVSLLPLCVICDHLYDLHVIQAEISAHPRPQVVMATPPHTPSHSHWTGKIKMAENSTLYMALSRLCDSYVHNHC